MSEWESAQDKSLPLFLQKTVNVLVEWAHQKAHHAGDKFLSFCVFHSSDLDHWKQICHPRKMHYYLLNIIAKYCSGSTRCRGHARQHVEQGGFPRSIVTQDCCDLSRINIQTYILKYQIICIFSKTLFPTCTALTVVLPIPWKVFLIFLMMTASFPCNSSGVFSMSTFSCKAGKEDIGLWINFFDYLCKVLFTSLNFLWFQNMSKV